MPTTDEQQRTDSLRFDYELRFFIRGQWGIMDDSGIAAGSDYDVSAATTTTAGVNMDSTSIPVVSTASFPSSGLICIAPDDDNENYDFVYYGSKTSTTFDDLTWMGFDQAKTVSEKQTNHDSGVAVTQWVEVTNYITGRITIERSFSGPFATWQAALGGYEYSSRLFRRDNTVLCKWRFRPSSGVMANWTGWKVAFIGYIINSTGQDEYERSRQWNATIAGAWHYLLKWTVPPHQIGKVDLADGKSVTVSSYLENTDAEQESGEFVGAPNLDGDNVVDSDISTLWISEFQPAVTPLTTHANGWRINEVYLEAAPGLPTLQWFELFYKGSTAGGGRWDRGHFVTKATTWYEWDDWPPDYFWWNGPLTNFLVPPSDISAPADGGFVVFCSNLVEFERRWRLIGGQVFDWRECQIGTFSIDKTGDFIARLHNQGFKRGNTTSGTVDAVWFGSITPANFGATAHCLGYSDGWTGSPVALPDAGRTIARTEPGKDNDDATDWAEESAPSVGGYSDGDEEYVSIDLGAMNIRLTAELSAGETTEMEVSATLGLTESGYVIIDGEIIEYQIRDDANKKLLTLTRGVSPGDPAEVHLVDALVEQYEDGIAYDCHLIDAVQWRRRAVYNSGTLVVPRVYEWYVSDDETVIYPDDEDWDHDTLGWENYWTRFVFDYVGGDDAVVNQLHRVGPIRARHAMLVIREMSDGGRAKINEINIFSATAERVDGDSGNEDTVDGAASGYIIRQFFIDWGLSESQITLDDEGRQFAKLENERGRIQTVVGDLLERTACVVVFAMDENCVHRTSPFHPHGTLESAEYTWTRDNVEFIDWDEPEGHVVSQVQLRARDAVDNDVIYEVRYPPEPMAIGEIQVIDDFVFGGSIHEGLKYAEQVFRRANGPLRCKLYPVGPAEWAKPGERHIVTWDLDTEDVKILGRNMIVESVKWDIELPEYGRDKSWRCVVEMEELVI